MPAQSSEKQLSFPSGRCSRGHHTKLLLKLHTGPKAFDQFVVAPLLTQKLAEAQLVYQGKEILFPQG